MIRLHFRHRFAVRQGFTLVEVAIVGAILCFLVLSAARLMHWSSMVSTNSRKELTGARLIQDIFARLRAINFYDVHSIDSGQANFGMLFGAAHNDSYRISSAKAFQSLHAEVQKAGFSHFTVNVEYMRRSLLGGAAGGAFNLVPVVTALDPVPVCSAGIPVKYCDINDSSVCFEDLNCDGDFFERPTVAPKNPSEFPDTHIKRVTVTIVDRRAQQIRSESQFLSLEGWTGLPSSGQEAGLFLSLTEPSSSDVVYSLSSSALSTAHNLSTLITFPLPTDYQAWPGDNLALAGVTEPNTNIQVDITNLPLISLQSDLMGNFSGFGGNVSSQFVEGWNSFNARATKGTSQSPLLIRRVIFDKTPPQVQIVAPSNGTTVRTRRPYIEATFNDVFSTNVVSGLGPQPHCYLRENNDNFDAGDLLPSCECDSQTGRILFFDGDYPSTRLPTKKLDDNKWYYAKIEAQDRALYKSSVTWRFRVDLFNDTDHPMVETASVFPAHNSTTSNSRPEIRVRFTDPANSGMFNSINPNRFRLCLDASSNVVVKKTSNGYPMGNFFDANTQTFHYTPPAPLASGLHWVSVYVEDWGNRSLDTNTAGALDTGFCDSHSSVKWRFTVP